MNHIDKFTEEDLRVLNSKKGIYELLIQEGELDLRRAIRRTNTETTIQELQVELIKMQHWVIQNKEKVVVIFEGRDAAGKGGAIRRIIERLNPRHLRVQALPKPSEDEESQWYFQRYVDVLPVGGEIVFFDRSWYNRAVVEPVNGFCRQKEYERFMNQVNRFEDMLTESGIRLIKIYMSISKKEQARRFAAISADPLKIWKMSKVDEEAQRLWDDYTEYKTRMFENAKAGGKPFKVIKANKKTIARVKAIKYILSKIPYDKDLQV